MPPPPRVYRANGAGYHQKIWEVSVVSMTDGCRGVYFHRLDMPGFRSVKKAVVTR